MPRTPGQRHFCRRCAPIPTCPPALTSRPGSSRSPTAAPSTSDAPAHAAPCPPTTLPDRPAAHADPAARDPDLWTALQRLPTKQRQAVAYHHIAGLPFAEIAELLGNSPDAARRAAADGLKTLRKHYREDETA